VALIDPGALQTMAMASELMEARDQLRRQQATIFGLIAALRSEQCASQALADLLDHVLADERYA
jgi:predicted outer membrane lipoprotein